MSARLSDHGQSPRAKPGRVGGRRAPRESWCSFCEAEGGFDDKKGNLVWGQLLPTVGPVVNRSHKKKRKGGGEMVSCWECGQSGRSTPLRHLPSRLLKLSGQVTFPA